LSVRGAPGRFVPQATADRITPSVRSPGTAGKAAAKALQA